MDSSPFWSWDESSVTYGGYCPDADLQMEDVYSAEELTWLRFCHDEHLTLAEIGKWVASIFATVWFRNRYPRVRGIAVHDGRGSPNPRGWRDDDICHMHLPRPTRHRLTILHELTHGLAFDAHGPEFCANYLALVKRFMGHDQWEDLRDNFVILRIKHRRPRQVEWVDPTTGEIVWLEHHQCV